MDWAHEYVPGATRASCSVCGVSRRFPDNLTFCVDKLFRCERCMEITAMERDQQIAAFRARAEERDIGIGILPFAEIPKTFLATAQERQAQLIPGWTPTSTFQDDFTIVPGGVGSSWTVSNTVNSTITAPSVGVARFTPGNGAGQAWVASVSIPEPSTGRFYSAFSFTFGSETVSGASGFGVRGTLAGNPSGNLETLGEHTAIGSGFFSLRHTGPTRLISSSVEVDQATKTGEMWWTGDGYVRAAVSGERTISVAGGGFTGTPFPYILALTNGVVLDVTDYVCFT